MSRLFKSKDIGLAILGSYTLFPEGFWQKITYKFIWVMKLVGDPLSPLTTPKINTSSENSDRKVSNIAELSKKKALQHRMRIRFEQSLRGYAVWI